jgi:hypothetical protein
LARVRPRSVIGENRALAIFDDPLRAKTALNGGLQYHEIQLAGMCYFANWATVSTCAE